MTDVLNGSAGRLAPILGGQFSNNAKHRGEEYFHSQLVAMMNGSAAEVSAQVQGNSLYQVSLKWSMGKLICRCTCPFFEDNSAPCKHLWATILAAEEQGHLSEVSLPLVLQIDTRVRAVDRKPIFFQPPPPPREPAWKAQLKYITESAASPRNGKAGWPANAEVAYLVNVAKSGAVGSLTIDIATRQRGKDGRWKNIPKPYSLRREQIPFAPLAEDREILTLLTGGHALSPYWYPGSYSEGIGSVSLTGMMLETVLPRILRTGRCYLPFTADDVEKPPLRWDDGEPSRFALEINGSAREGWKVSGYFLRGTQRLPAEAILVATTDGILVMPDSVARFVGEGASAWIAGLRSHGPLAIAEAEREEFLNRLLHAPGLPALDLPEEWRYEEIRATARPSLKIFRSDARYVPAKDRLKAKLSFTYQGHVVEETANGRGLYDPATRQFFWRDAAAEQAAITQLKELGLRFTAGIYAQPAEWSFASTKLPRLVRSLVESGWQVTAEGKVFRQPGQFSAVVSSGLDWFELQGAVDYGDTSAALPQLLAAMRRGEAMVTLDDGSYGLLPEEWLRRFGQVAMMGEAITGEAGQDHIRFSASQAGILDALLATQPAVNCDEAFQHVRRQLAQFASVQPAQQPPGFQGRLREYQREGLGWMHFLRQFSFGGCLADDMGVGKTAQVLALLEERRVLRIEGAVDAPSLVVVPKSLIFNWKQESQRFTPLLRVLDYTGLGRGSQDEFSAYDLILTTYGTLRRDALDFKDRVFDYIILDEAQAIKNEKTESAKAARLLRGDYRLALSGTPVENHLGELWSLFAFLNPGMLGGSGAFANFTATKADSDGEARKLLAHALRPFLLRRTKEQVAKELPAKVEQTVYCEMETEQRRLYNELRDHYRDVLLGKIRKEGMGKAKMQVLEALLRLRQAACHPGLVDRKRVDDPSTKLEVLMEQLRAVLEEGHKALVFSQFTSLLGILRSRLAAEEITYEYLDGKTVNRQERVERFQQDAACPLFLISLKAGGVGLNLTAADYVFILDPWWNPAVEAQAVDRTHRIGQTRRVFAYRLITRDTVEEKVLVMQETKRNLADAIIGAQNSLIKEMTKEDLELLLS